MMWQSINFMMMRANNVRSKKILSTSGHCAINHNPCVIFRTMNAIWIFFSWWHLNPLVVISDGRLEIISYWLHFPIRSNAQKLSSCNCNQLNNFFFAGSWTKIWSGHSESKQLDALNVHQEIQNHYLFLLLLLLLLLSLFTRWKYCRSSISFFLSGSSIFSPFFWESFFYSRERFLRDVRPVW